MAPLITLLVVYVVARLVLRGTHAPALAGRIALASMLVVTGVAHVTRTAALAAMVPPFIPEPVLVVYLTGVLELAFAAALIARPSPRLGWLLAALFVALLPANIYSAVAGVGLGGGRGAAYLWFRIPLQLLFIVWALRSTGAVVHFRRDASSTADSGRPLALHLRGAGRRRHDRQPPPSQHPSVARADRHDHRDRLRGDENHRWYRDLA